MHNRLPALCRWDRSRLFRTSIQGHSRGLRAPHEHCQQIPSLHSLSVFSTDISGIDDGNDSPICSILGGLHEPWLSFAGMCCHIFICGAQAGELLYSSFRNPMALHFSWRSKTDVLSSLSTAEAVLLGSRKNQRIRLIRPNKILLSASATAFWIEKRAISGADNRILNFQRLKLRTNLSLPEHSSSLPAVQSLGRCGGSLGELFFLSIRAFGASFAASE